MHAIILKQTGALAYGSIQDTPSIRNADGSWPMQRETGRPAALRAKKYKSAVFRRGSRRASSRWIRERKDETKGERCDTPSLPFILQGQFFKSEINFFETNATVDFWRFREPLFHLSFIFRNKSFQVNKWLSNVTRVKVYNFWRGNN